MLVVEVQTPGGVVVGSSVAYTSRTFMEPSLCSALPGSCVSSSENGESVGIELPDGKNLFVLWMKNTGAFTNRILRAAEPPHQIPSRGDVSYAEYYDVLKSRRDPVPIKKEELARLHFVTFKDINDPHSIMVLDPHKLSQGLGRGYKLKSITIQITDERATDARINEMLPWFDDIINYIKPGKTRSPRKLTPQEKIEKSDFIGS